jgi:hypothetical protein
MLSTFEHTLFPVKACLHVLFEAAQYFFGRYRHNLTRPRRLINGLAAKVRNKINLRSEFALSVWDRKAWKPVNGYVVIQVLKKCTSRVTGECLYSMMNVDQWGCLLYQEMICIAKREGLPLMIPMLSSTS